MTADADQSSPPARPTPDAIILAAGKGTRMSSELPKVLHEVAGRPMIRWVVEACQAAGCARCVIVVGYRGEDVRRALADVKGVEFVEQTEQLGTGHAARMAQPAFEGRPETDVFVLTGDAPLIRSDTLTKILHRHHVSYAAATLATAILDDPTGYGRVRRDDAGGFLSIVEQKDATPEQLTIAEVNPSYYCFRSDALFSALSDVSSDNAQGEYYLTDVPGLLRAQGQKVTVVDAVPPEDVLGVNTLEQLAQVDRLLRDRTNTPAGADRP